MYTYKKGLLDEGTETKFKEQKHSQSVKIRRNVNSRHFGNTNISTNLRIYNSNNVKQKPLDFPKGFRTPRSVSSKIYFESIDG